MSKRFGRNQKRRLKREIENLENSLHTHVDSAKWMRDRLNVCEDTIRLTAEVLGKHFCTLPPKTIASLGLDNLLVYRMSKRVEFPTAMYEADNLKNLACSVQNAVHELDMYAVEMRTYQVRDMVHVRINGPRDERYAYALSGEMKHRYPKQRLIEQVSRELAELMVRGW